MAEYISDICDMRHLEWKVWKGSPGTAGTLLKAEDYVDGKHLFYKLSNFDDREGEIGVESVNELIVSRLLDKLNFPHLNYDLLHARIIINDTEYFVHPCVSEDFRNRGERKISFADFYDNEKERFEPPYQFCRRMGWEEEIIRMLVCDFLILNRDRHGANVEVLIDGSGKARLAPLYDHGLSLLWSSVSDEAVKNSDPLADTPVQSFVGGRSVKENLRYIPTVLLPEIALSRKDVEEICAGLQDILSPIYIAALQEMLMRRADEYENIRISRLRAKEKNRSLSDSRGE